MNEIDNDELRLTLQHYIPLIEGTGICGIIRAIRDPLPAHALGSPL